MTIPVWVLLGFAGWTLVILMISVGVYRWGMVLRGRAGMAAFSADRPEGPDWYRRAMRAHANCVENLVVYAAVVVALVATGVRSPVLDVLALVLLGARVVHSTIHVAFRQTDRVASVRFAFFFVQFVCMAWMGVYVALHV